jgi:hypothetical protein
MSDRGSERHGEVDVAALNVEVEAVPTSATPISRETPASVFGRMRRDEAHDGPRAAYMTATAISTAAIMMRMTRAMPMA